MPDLASGVRRVKPSCDKIPAVIEPQLCMLVERPPSGANWLHEIKYDGWRLLARKAGDEVRLRTRGGIEWAERLPHLAEAIRGLGASSLWLDGEIVHLDDAGLPDFEQLQRDMRVGDERRLVFHVFDLLWLNGEDLTRDHLLDRKARLREVIQCADSRIRFTEYVVAEGAEVFARADLLDLEGIVSKRVDGAYYPGVRSRGWQKSKCWRTQTVVVGGVQFDSDGHLEGLLVGTSAEGGLRFEGLAEFGLTRIPNLGQLLIERTTTESPFLGEWRRSDRRFWVRPELRIEIRALPRRPGRLLRHATVLRLP
jgi:bifunctional non-homologous end joining protein LigD